MYILIKYKYAFKQVLDIHEYIDYNSNFLLQWFTIIAKFLNFEKSSLLQQYLFIIHWNRSTVCSCLVNSVLFWDLRPHLSDLRGPVNLAGCQNHLTGPLDHPVLPRNCGILFDGLLHDLLQTQLHHFFNLNNNTTNFIYINQTLTQSSYFCPSQYKIWNVYCLLYLHVSLSKYHLTRCLWRFILYTFR